MNKFLIKNEFLKFVRMSSFSSRGKKSEKANPVATYLLIMGLLAVFFFIMMFEMFQPLAAACVKENLGWLCYTYAFIMAVVFAVIGSVFMAQSQLYRAKDNDLLLSLPIPPSQILFCRMLPLYAQNFYFCFIILLPAYVALALSGGVTVLGLIFFILSLIVIPLFTLTLCCLLGFVVAMVASHVKHSNIVTIIFSLILLCAYFAVYSQFNSILSALIQNNGQIADDFKAYAYPLYLVGKMIEGDVLGACITILICGGLFALLYLLLSKTYIYMITKKDKAKKSVYRKDMARTQSVWKSLIGKENKRFLRSTAYLLNCGLGVFLLFVFAILIAVGGNSFLAAIDSELPELTAYLPALILLLICMLSATDGITAPSISLEGKSIYVLQSLPVESWKPLFAKIFFQVLFNTPMAIICGVVSAVILRPSAVMIALFILMPIAVNFLFASLGLIFNLKKPMLKWENETMVVKQSISVLFLILSMLGVTGLIVGISFPATSIMSMDLYLCICFTLLSIGSALLMAWIKRRGVHIWENLS